MIPLSNFSDEDAQQVVRRSLRLLAVVTLLAVPLVWWKMDWRSAAMLAVGSAISGAGLWKWLRLMSVVIVRMDTTGSDGKAHPMGSVLAGFFITLVLMLAALYVSLKFLDGSVYALAAGLAMGVFALTFEALRLVKAWTV